MKLKKYNKALLSDKFAAKRGVKVRYVPNPVIKKFVLSGFLYWLDRPPPGA